MKQVKELQELEIVKVADKGLGMGYTEGKVIFVERAVPGDVVDVRLFKNKKNYGMGYPLRYVKLSPNRVDPFCVHFGVCGGCRWQNLPYPLELEYKTQLVSDALQRITGKKPAEVEPAIGAGQTTHYRNKLEYTFSNKRWLSPDELNSEVSATRDIIGYHIPGYHDKVLDVRECHLQPGPSDAIRQFVGQRAAELGLSFYDLQRKTGLLRNLQIRNNRSGGFLIILVMSRLHSKAEQLLRELPDRFPQIRSVYYALNDKANASMSDVHPVLVYGSPCLEELLGKIRYRIGPLSFFQTNPAQAEVLMALVREYAALRPDDRVYDLYTGLGSIALYLADTCREIIGLEYLEAAVEDARQNARDNGIANARFFSGDMSKLLTEDFIEAQGRPDVLITDPPRAGMTDKVNRRILESGARRVVYVSCNPVSQARDLEQLMEGYDLLRLQPVDMFPRTYHIENIAVLEKRGGLNP